MCLQIFPHLPRQLPEPSVQVAAAARPVGSRDPGKDGLPAVLSTGRRVCWTSGESWARATLEPLSPQPIAPGLGSLPSLTRAGTGGQTCWGWQAQSPLSLTLCLLRPLSATISFFISLLGKVASFLCASNFPSVKWEMKPHQLWLLGGQGKIEHGYRNVNTVLCSLLSI